MIFNYSGYAHEAGCDEAGRGCLAGPVTAAAVILPKEFDISILNDSKKLSSKKREELRSIIEKQALAWSVAFVEEKIIDKINILKASILAMHQALDGLKIKPEFIIVDGNKFYPYRDTGYRTFVKGDGKYASIAAASILAKTHRDEYMMKIHREYPQYAWDKNKGYPTRQHRLAIEQHGISTYHRKSFAPVARQLKLPL